MLLPQRRQPLRERQGCLPRLPRRARATCHRLRRQQQRMEQRLPHQSPYYATRSQSTPTQRRSRIRSRQRSGLAAALARQRTLPRARSPARDRPRLNSRHRRYTSNAHFSSLGEICGPTCHRELGCSTLSRSTRGTPLCTQIRSYHRRRNLSTRLEVVAGLVRRRTATSWCTARRVRTGSVMATGTAKSVTRCFS